MLLLPTSSGRLDSTISIPNTAGLDPLAVYSRRARSVDAADLGLFAAVVIDVLEVEGVNVSREISI